MTKVRNWSRVTRHGNHRLQRYQYNTLQCRKIIQSIVTFGAVLTYNHQGAQFRETVIKKTSKGVTSSHQRCGSPPKTPSRRACIHWHNVDITRLWSFPLPPKTCRSFRLLNSIGGFLQCFASSLVYFPPPMRPKSVICLEVPIETIHDQQTSDKKSGNVVRRTLRIQHSSVVQDPVCQSL